jgi:hypothetical protein
MPKQISINSNYFEIKSRSLWFALIINSPHAMKFIIKLRK